MRTLDIKILRDAVIYDADSGEIYSRHSRGNIKAGKRLGTNAGEGYKTIHIHGVTLYFHRAAFAIHNGYWPEMVDHINGDRLDNRACNLRASNKIFNARNAAPKNGNRFRGACMRPFGWEVLIRFNGKQIYIGRFKNEMEAAYAYDMASLKYHGKHGRRNFLPLVV